MVKRGDIVCGCKDFLYIVRNFIYILQCSMFGDLLYEFLGPEASLSGYLLKDRVYLVELCSLKDVPDKGDSEEGFNTA